MKTLIKLIIAALIVHATWRAGNVYFQYFQLKDSLQQIAQFSGTSTEKVLHGQALEAAKKLGITLEPDRLTVRRENNHTLIDASYDQSIEMLPRYFYPWHFNVNVDAFTIQ